MAVAFVILFSLLNYILSCGSKQTILGLSAVEMQKTDFWQQAEDQTARQRGHDLCQIL